MTETTPEDIPFDDLGDQLERALHQGLIWPGSPGYNVARALVDGEWKDLAEPDRVIFNQEIRPILERLDNS